jgi:hypothetical protein
VMVTLDPFVRPSWRLMNRPDCETVPERVTPAHA